jgi:hypothetical protein
MSEKNRFYLGRVFDMKRAALTESAVLYDPANLTTHAVVVGMTGSGKTGLCIDVLEEAALRSTPALLIDPKGDITNLLLHFPDMKATDFEPWVNPDEARRAGKTTLQAAEETAALWKKGLSDWGITTEKIKSLQSAAQFTIYTPGSNAGVPVNILASLSAPKISWAENEEMLRDKIASTVTSLLGLVGMKDVDPLRSREHILLANIFESAWSQGKDLSLDEIILQTQNPPFTKLGVFDINSFFPQKDRFELSVLLNNILASPAFKVWLEGTPLEVDNLLHTSDGKPRHSIFYIAHLSDAERMFFVTLLLSALETWMRAQSGTSDLRALLYVDELFGYLPPVANPPSKPLFLRLLKQARAFGLGLLLATQNPVDLDYKALSNIGTWFIGKLQTDQDKQRLLDGLEGASSQINRADYDKLISALGKRVFLMRSVHEKETIIFQTRWAMNYMAGPMTTAQIPALNRLAGVQTTKPSPAPVKPGAAPSQPSASAAAPAAASAGTTTKPALPTQINEYFLAASLSVDQAAKAAGITASVASKGTLYRPAILAQARLRLYQPKYNLSSDVIHTALIRTPERRGGADWAGNRHAPFETGELLTKASAGATFTTVEAPLNDLQMMNSLKQDFANWALQANPIRVWENKALKIYGEPRLSKAEFITKCNETARQTRDAETKKAAAALDKKIDTLKDRLARLNRELNQDQEEVAARQREEIATHVQTFLSIFGGRTGRISTSLSKNRMTQKAKAEVEETAAEAANLQKDIAELEQERSRVVEEVNSRWGDVASQVSEIPILPAKKDLTLEVFGALWLPYHLVESGGKVVEVAGYA